MTPQDYAALGRMMYEKCPTPKPTWEQLGEVTKSVWIERATEYANRRQQATSIQNEAS